MGYRIRGTAGRGRNRFTSQVAPHRFIQAFETLVEKDCAAFLFPLGFSKKTYYGHRNAHEFFHVVHHHQRCAVGFLGIHRHSGSRPGLPHSEQMVSYPEGDVCRGFLLVSGVIQNCLYCFQSGTVRCTVDHRMIP